MPTPEHDMPQPSPSPWSEPISTSGTFNKVLVPSLFLFDRAGTAAGVVTQPEADRAALREVKIMAEVHAILDEIQPVPVSWDGGSGKCSYKTPTTWPDGTPAVLICSLAPGHDGLHEPLDTTGNLMPLPVEDVAEEAVA